MSVSTSFDDLFANFSNDAWALTGKPRRVLEDPTEQLNLTDFPCVVFAYDPTTDHRILIHTPSDSFEHIYTIAIYLFLGAKTTPLVELHKRARQPWAIQVAKIIAAHITLNGDVSFMGDGQSDEIVNYRPGFYPWGSSTDAYFGFRFVLQINEITAATIGA